MLVQVWTIDLAALLTRFGLRVTLSTITLGINSDYASESFYMAHLEEDERRVGGGWGWGGGGWGWGWGCKRGEGGREERAQRCCMQQGHERTLQALQ
jgi:hypothetical protein